MTLKKTTTLTPLPLFLETLESHGGQVYEVGGSLRDSLLNLPHKDHGLLVTGLPMDQLIKLLARFGSVQQVGKSFGVIKFKPKNGTHEFDIALPREERSTGQGHRDFEVTFDPFLAVEKDLGRRDFTLNALARRLKSGEILDPFGGQKDLEYKVLRQVFPKAFEEDPLRMLRAIQFSARMNLKIEIQTFESLKKDAALIQTVSAERIVEELRKLFLSDKPSYGFRLMQEGGLFTFLFPELSMLLEATVGLVPSLFDRTLKVLDTARHSSLLRHAGDLELMLAALFHEADAAQQNPLQKQTNYQKWIRRHPVSMWGIDPIAVKHLLCHQDLLKEDHKSEKDLRRLIYRVNPKWIFKALDLNFAICEAKQTNIEELLELRKNIEVVLFKNPPLSLSDLAINGEDLMEWGVPKGPKIGLLLKMLLEQVIDDPSQNQAKALKEWLKKTNI